MTQHANAATRRLDRTILPQPDRAWVDHGLPVTRQEMQRLQHEMLAEAVRNTAAMQLQSMEKTDAV